MRDLAIGQYNCINCKLTSENNEDIKRWKDDLEYTYIHNIGQNKWYKPHSVQIVYVLREYSHTDT